jgi:ankyrin repeat protein
LFLAAREGKKQVVMMLLGAGADPNGGGKSRDGDTPLIIACSEGYIKVAIKLIEAKANIDATNLNGWTALTYASHYGRTNVVKLLLTHHAAVNVKCKVRSL